MNEEELILLFMSRNAASVLSEMKKDRGNHLYSKYSSINNAYSLLEEIIKNFYKSFFEENKQSFDYMFLYYSFQSFLFSDPDNYFLHTEDNVQELLYRTYFSFCRFMERHYSPENLAEVDRILNFDTFIIRNFTRVMALEFRNLKRVSESEKKKPCSVISDNSLSYDEFISSLDYGYDISDRLLFLTLSDIEKVYE